MLKNLPEPGKRYLVNIKTSVGKDWYTIAEWIPKYYRIGDWDVFEGDLDYSEELDEYYWPVGWYENQYTPDINWLIPDPVVAWKEIDRDGLDWNIC